MRCACSTPGTVLLEPVAQARPLAQQRLVGDLDDPLGDREQPPIREHLHDVRDVGVLRSGSNSASGTRRRTASSASPGAESRSTARASPCCWAVNSPPDLREPRDGAADPAGLEVRLERDRATVPTLPQLEQWAVEGAGGARFLAHLGDERLGQRGFDVDADTKRWLLDRSSIFVRRHRADQHVVRSEQFREGGCSEQRP